MKDFVRELRRLRKQIDVVLETIENDRPEHSILVEMTEQERLEYVRRYGPDTFLVGDYVIKNRNLS